MLDTKGEPVRQTGWGCCLVKEILRLLHQHAKRSNPANHPLVGAEVAKQAVLDEREHQLGVCGEETGLSLVPE